MQFLHAFKKTAAILAVVQVFLFNLLIVVPIVLLTEYIGKKLNKKLPIDSIRQTAWHNIFLFIIQNMLEIDVKIEKPQDFSLDDAPVVYLHTHASIIDNVGQIAIQKMPFSYLAKKELFKIPVVNLYLKFLRAVPIDRNNLQDAMKSFEKLQEQTTVGRNVMIAPEGTRRRKLSTENGENIQPFKKGPFHFAKNSNLPLVPMIFNGGSRLMNVGSVFPQSGTIYIKILSPIMPETYKNMTPQELTTYVEKYFKDNYEFKKDEDIYKTNKDSTLYAIAYYIINAFFIYKIFFQVTYNVII